MRARWMCLAIVAALVSGARLAACAGHDGIGSGHGDRQPGPGGAGRHRDDHRPVEGHCHHDDNRRRGRLHGAVSRPGHLRGERRAHRLQEARPPGRRGAGERSRAHRRQLEVGALTETTNVVAAAPLVRTDSSEVGTVIEEKAIRELPLNGRNFATLVYLVPGVTPGQAGENLSGASTFNPRGASNFNALGQQANTNGWLDRRHRQQRVHLQHRHRRAVGRIGARVQGAERRLLGRVRPRRRRRLGLDQVGQQRVARHRRSTSSATTCSTPTTTSRSGRRRAAPKCRSRRCAATSSAASIGGPLSIPGLYKGSNRTFFFADYSGLKEARGLSFVNTVPTVARAQRRLQRLPQPDDRRAHPHLRSADDAAQSRLQPVAAGERDQPAVPARSVPRATSFRRTASTRSVATSPASIRSRTSRATSTTT